MDHHRTRGVRCTQRSRIPRTSTPISPTIKTLQNGGRRICYCNPRSPQSGRRRRKKTPGSILLRIILCHRKKLRHLQQRAACNHQSTTTMENLPLRISPRNCHIHGPLQLTILEGTVKDQQTSSKRVPRVIRV